MTRRIAETIEDLPDWEAMTTRSGLAFMQDILSGVLAGAPMWRTLSIEPVEVEQGRVVFEGMPVFDTINPMRGTHGGWYGAVLDSCMGCAVMTKLPRGSFYTTLEYKVNITRALPMGTTVHAVGNVQHAGRSTAVAVGEVRGVEDGKLYATGSTTCMIMTA